MKANFLSISLVLAIVAGLSGCATTANEAMSESEYRSRNCHFDGGFKLGMNDSLAGKPMSTTLSQPCTEESRSDTERGYREGYTKGLDSRGKQQPVAIATHVTESPPIVAKAKPAKTCASAKDCKGGQFCKAREDKVLVCMGDGRHGDFCDAHVDCRHSGFCRTSGDGLKRCMKEGPKNSICASSTDCQESLLCKESDGPNKVCR